ncbi:MAG: MATE family efflux transporter [Woeseia sp.]
MNSRDSALDRDVWRIALPMILSNISVPLLGMVDTGVTGHLEDAAYLGAVAIGATVFGFLYTGVNFLRMGTTGIAAQSFGADDAEGLRTSLGQALIVALAIAFLLLLLQRPIGIFALDMIGADENTRAFAAEYFFIRIWSAPATLANYALIGWFIGLQNARIPLLIVLVTNLANIALDFLLVFVFDMKVAGVAAASVIAEFSGMIAGLAIATAELKRRGGQWDRSRLLKLRAYTGFLAVNGHLFVRTMALMFTFGFVTAQGARQGALVLAANAILMNLQSLLSFALDGFAHAAEALVGKAVGAKSRLSLQRSVAVTLRWSLYVAIGFGALFLATGPLFIRMLTDLPEVRETTLRYLPWMVVSPIVSVWSFLYDGVFVGATRAREMRDIMLVSTFAVFIPSFFAFRFLGNDGLWLAFMLFMASRGVGMHLFYKRRLLPALPVPASPLSET